MQISAYLIRFACFNIAFQKTLNTKRFIPNVINQLCKLGFNFYCVFFFVCFFYPSGVSRLNVWVHFIQFFFFFFFFLVQ